MAPQDEADVPVITTYASLIGTFCNFLNVCIHTILYERSIYPRASFLSARKYNYPVRQSRHPKVCQWITDAVAAIEEELLKGTVDKIGVVIYDSATNKPMERFMFDVGRFPTVPLGEKDTPFEQGTSKRPSAVDISEQFRAAMSRLALCGMRLRPIPDNCSFTLAVEMKEDKEPPVGHPQPWIPTEPTLQKSKKDHAGAEEQDEDEGGMQKRKRGDDLGGVRTTPLRAVDAGDMIFEMWIEEGKSKGSFQSATSTSP